MEDRYLVADGGCGTVSEYQETDQVHISALWGLWIILAIAVALASLVALYQYYGRRRTAPEQHKAIVQRTEALRRSVSIKPAQRNWALAGTLAGMPLSERDGPLTRASKAGGPRVGGMFAKSTAGAPGTCI